MFKINAMKTLEEVSEFHGHICPGLALGYKVASFALDKLGDRAKDEELVCIVENDSCAVDAVQVLTGCTFGKGNLIFRDHGKQVYTFITRPSGESLRIAISWTPPKESDSDKIAWDAYRLGDRTAEVLDVVHRRKSDKIKSIMAAADDELFDISMDPVSLPQAARIHPSVKCEKCGEKTMETRVRLLAAKHLCLPCFESELGQ